jgi:hypothetical protein
LIYSLTDGDVGEIKNVEPVEFERTARTLVIRAETRIREQRQIDAIKAKQAEHAN